MQRVTQVIVNNAVKKMKLGKTARPSNVDTEMIVTSGKIEDGGCDGIKPVCSTRCG